MLGVFDLANCRSGVFIKLLYKGASGRCIDNLGSENPQSSGICQENLHQSTHKLYRQIGTVIKEFTILGTFMSVWFYSQY